MVKPKNEFENLQKKKILGVTKPEELNKYAYIF